MELELTNLTLRYEKLRRRNDRKERQLVASLADKGQLLPVVVVASGDKDGRYILVDGYKRVRALGRLRRDIVHAMLWELAELEGVLLERLMRTGESDGALEQGWLLEELNERFSLSHEELAHRFDKSQSWVSRRLALVRDVPREVQERVQSSALPAHAAMKFLVPMARAKSDDCRRLVLSLGQQRLSTREVGTLYAAWVAGNAQTRALVVSQPLVVLRALHETKLPGVPADKARAATLLDDLGILIGTSRRARKRIADGALLRLLPPDKDEIRRTTQQASWECAALFRLAASPLGASCAPDSADAPSAQMTQLQPINTESADAQ